MRTVLRILLGWTLMAFASGTAAALDVGARAPDFTLPSTGGGTVSLRQFLAKKLVLIEFYSADASPTCAANLTTRKVDYGKFQELDVQILGVSSSNPFSQQTLADSLKLPYPLLSDSSELKVIRSYGVLHPSKPIAQRSFFLIDKQGIVRGMWAGRADEVLPSESILALAREIAQKR